MENAVIPARVSTSHTGEFEAELSHLTRSTAFVDTLHEATFGDAVELCFYDLVIPCEVAFVADSPMGWVVRFEPNPALDRILAGASPAVPAEIDPFAVPAGGAFLAPTEADPFAAPGEGAGLGAELDPFAAPAEGASLGGGAEIDPFAAPAEIDPFAAPPGIDDLRLERSSPGAPTQPESGAQDGLWGETTPTFEDPPRFP